VRLKTLEVGEGHCSAVAPTSAGFIFAGSACHEIRGRASIHLPDLGL